jgi:uncharacterized membrane protein YqjE
MRNAWWFTKVYLRVTFSGAMWGSWYFIMLYALIAWTNLTDFQWCMLHWQAGVLVVIALIFGLWGTLMGLAEHKRKQQETDQRRAYAAHQKHA